MPLGIVSDDEFEQELNRLKKVEIKAEIIDQKPRGRKEGDLTVPSGLRKIIGEEGIVNGRRAAIQLAEEFHISHESADAYRVGATSTASYHRKDRELSNHLSRVKLRILNKSSRRLISALDKITEEKLESAKLRDITSVAQAMSVIMKNMEPEVPNHAGPNFIFYCPQPRKEEDFDVIEVKE